ncbi:MAG: ATP-binding protein [Synechococcaceae cyanobacterium RL_1_2]|nr:ATP-binding protein [Synechococcaceae cyanobacterium RL_1_2]
MLRQNFIKSRNLEYFTVAELSMMMGAEPQRWPIMLIKECIDNSLDASEKFGPVVLDLTITTNDFTITDDGPGIPTEVIKNSLDYSVRVSSNDAYVSPTRGQLGNALKLLWAAAYVHSGHALVEVTSQNQHHTITIEKDILSGEPIINLTTNPNTTTGTTIKVVWDNMPMGISRVTDLT